MKNRQKPFARCRFGRIFYREMQIVVGARVKDDVRDFGGDNAADSHTPPPPKKKTQYPIIFPVTPVEHE